MKVIKKLKKLLKNPIAFITDSNIIINLRLIGNKRNELLSYFNNKNNFYRRKTPNSNKYPYYIHDSYEIFKKSKKYEKLFLVGENWLDKNSKKPIALMIGFNNWKYGFTADYLKEYRVAYAPRKLSFSKSLLLFNLNPKPDVIVVWGYTENYFINYYSNRNNIPIYRMEDGFIRSALLGASHATPYSLILDKKGLYYNPETETDLENILNNYNFKKDKKLLDEAQISLNLIIDMKISKYNTPSTEKISKLGIKTKKRIVVLGQVDNDAAIRYGNPDKWTSEELIKLARYENPEAEVIYRPHPEVYKGYQKSKFKQKRIEYFAKVASPNEPLLEFLETIDHAYVINSLSGFEALLRGIKVTTVGAAFYAGWGLTDDRYTLLRRNRILSLLELFAGAYLRYPKYLADLNNNYIGLKATCYSIHADAYVEKFNIYKDFFKNKNIEALTTSDYWAYLLLNNKSILSLEEEKSIISSNSFKKYFEGNDSELFQFILLYFVAGALQHDESRDFFIQKIRIYINTQVLNQFLYDMLEYYPGEYIMKHFSWLLKENNEFHDANSLMLKHLEKTSINKIEEKPLKICQNKNNEYSNNNNGLIFCLDNNQDDSSLPFEEIDTKNLWEALETCKETLQYNDFLNITKKLLISNNANTLLFNRLSEMAKLRMDNNSTVLISNFLQKLDIFAHNRSSVHLELESFNFNTSKESFEYITKLFSLQLRLNPDRINRSWAILKNYFNSNGYYKLFSSIIKLYSKVDIHKAVTYLELNEPTESLNILKNIINTGEKSDKLSVEYSKVLFTLGKYKEAKKVIKEAIKTEATHANYTECLRQLKAKGKFSEALEVAQDGLSKKLMLTNEGHIMPIYFGLGRIEEGFKCFHNSALKYKIIHAFGNDKYRHTNSLDNINNLLLIFSSGPAEEMRFSSIYNEISEAIGCDNFQLTCDYRLKNILSRSFPNISFIPVKRTRFFTPEYPIDNYDLLPSSELCNALDNNAMKYVESSSEIKLVSELFFHFRKNYNDFRNNKPHLIVDKKRVNYFKEQLPKDTILIGLSWRSSLTNAMRNIHYLSIEDMIPLFNIPNVSFVNLQYDECTHELDIIRDKYNIDIINFPGLDQMNDFDGVAGLMQNLDIVISPFTAVIELAGSIGVKGILFSNHGESHWRRTAKTDSDVWYESVKVVGSGEVGDKKAIVADIKKELLQLI